MSYQREKGRDGLEAESVLRKRKRIRFEPKTRNSFIIDFCQRGWRRERGKRFPFRRSDVYVYRMHVLLKQYIVAEHPADTSILRI